MTQEQIQKIEKMIKFGDPEMRTVGILMIIGAVESKNQWKLMYSQYIAPYLSTRSEKRSVKYLYQTTRSEHSKKKKDEKRDRRQAVLASQKCRPRDV